MFKPSLGIYKLSKDYRVSKQLYQSDSTSLIIALVVR
jgi:hypothetical protein